MGTARRHFPPKRPRVIRPAAGVAVYPGRPGRAGRMTRDRASRPTLFVMTDPAERERAAPRRPRDPPEWLARQTDVPRPGNRAMDLHSSRTVRSRRRTHVDHRDRRGRVPRPAIPRRLRDWGSVDVPEAVIYKGWILPAVAELIGERAWGVVGGFGETPTNSVGTSVGASRSLSSHESLTRRYGRKAPRSTAVQRMRMPSA